MAKIGEIIDDKYEILVEVGHGGMSTVYLAIDKRLNKQWAVKEVKHKSQERIDEIVIQSAIDEANMIKRLDHPAIVRIVDIIDNNDALYIVEDYVEGETLSNILERDGAQPQELVIKWMRQLCDALEYLHTRKPPIIYRDMKPDNVMLKPDGDIKIIDFGIAREYKENNIADTMALGTKGYAAPEQFGGQGQTDARTDIYCLGVTLYHLLTGHNPRNPPYELYPIRYWNPQLSKGLEEIILKCTKLNPKDRYQSCAEIIQALDNQQSFECIRKTWKSTILYIVSSLINILKTKVKLSRNKKRKNPTNFPEKDLPVYADDARYMAKIFADIQKDERNCTIIKGPDYDE